MARRVESSDSLCKIVMSDYSGYNGDSVHDMWTDYSYDANTGGETGYFSERFSGVPSTGYKPIRVRLSKRHNKIKHLKLDIAMYERRNRAILQNIAQMKAQLQLRTVGSKKYRKLQNYIKCNEQSYNDNLERIAKVNRKITEIQTSLRQDIKLSVYVLIGIIIFVAFDIWYHYCPLKMDVVN